MDIYSSLFGLRFVEIPTDTSSIFGNDRVMIWHDDVLVYNVWNDENLGVTFLGYLYLDCAQGKTSIIMLDITA